MDVALFLLYPRVRPHFETDLELAQQHLDAGDRVTLLTCSGVLAGCDSNPEHDRVDCLKCIGRCASGLGLLRGAYDQESLERWLDRPGEVEAPDAKIDLPESVEQLKAMRHRSFDWGDAVASSAISLFRDPWLDMVRHGAVVERLLRGTRQVYDAARAFLSERRPQRVYVFNGRMASARAVLRACQAEDIDCWIHERGRDRSHFALHVNHLPQDIDAIADRIERCWDASSDSEQARIETARQWYSRRASGKETNWRSFTAQQVVDKLPREWQTEARNLVLFTSSEDECAAVGGKWHAGPYDDQLSGMRAIARHWNERSGSDHFFIRVHPNSTGLPDRYHRELARLTGKHVTVIGPTEDVDTYSLIRSADTVLTFNSTAGIEAVYWGRPSILIGNAFYRRLGSTYQPTSHEELVDWMSRSLQPQPIEAALKYAYYWATLGQPYQYYTVDDLFRGRFRGKRIGVGLRDRLQIEWERHAPSWLRRSA